MAKKGARRISKQGLTQAEIDAKRGSGNLGGVSRKKQVAMKSIGKRSTVGHPSKDATGRGTVPSASFATTPSGRVAAKQRAKAVADSPIKPTTTKKPPSKKNNASRAVQAAGGSEGVPVGQYRNRRGVLKNVTPTTPSGRVADKQRKKAVKDSPIKAQTTKAPRPKRKPAEDPNAGEHALARSEMSPAERADPANRRDARGRRVQSYDPKKGPSTAQKKANAAKMGKDPAKVKDRFVTNKAGQVKKVRAGLSMDPKQVARRAKRGFPSGH